MFVKDVMTPNPITVAPETSFAEAMDIIRRKKVRRLPVVKGGKLVGIVAEKDLLSASPSKATSLDVWEITSLLHKLKVEEIMTKDVVTVSPDTPIEEAAVIMADKKIGALPVVKGEKLVGIITETDIFKTFVNMLGARESGVRYVFKLKNVPGLLAKIAMLIYETGGNVISVASYEVNEDEYSVIVKVSGIDVNAFEKRFSEEIQDASIVDSRFISV
ncbi:MAG: acetoin utilization protein AcuB [Thermotogota bacterium]|nr:acetoin utilization protein AcuB [Thermotogota bacterium]MDK2865536.1 acetoin utilization protein AcuB [Thermotogota bacterium]HCZ06072.1 hypothetical protein [Thermotogota bacterium]